jgi:hypothetical protein
METLDVLDLVVEMIGILEVEEVLKAMQDTMVMVEDGILDQVG